MFTVKPRIMCILCAHSPVTSYDHAFWRQILNYKFTNLAIYRRNKGPRLKPEWQPHKARVRLFKAFVWFVLDAGGCWFISIVCTPLIDRLLKSPLGSACNFLPARQDRYILPIFQIRFVKIGSHCTHSLVRPIGKLAGLDLILLDDNPTTSMTPNP